MTTNATTSRAVDWAVQLADQLDWHWDQQLRPRLEGLTDAEYRWEPVAGCWSVRPRAEAVTATPVGSGAVVMDHAFPPPEPAPVTTIAWRLNHVIVGVFGARNAAHFGGPPKDHDRVDYPLQASRALDALDAGRAHWSASVRALDDAALAEPCGPAEGPFGHLPMAALVLHIHREVIHHGAEIALLRDLYAATGGATPARPSGEGR